MRPFFFKREIVVFRKREGNTFKDRYFPSVEDAKSHAFKHKMNNGGDYQILKGFEEPMFHRAYTIITQTKLRWFGKSIPLWIPVLIITVAISLCRMK